MNHEEHEGKHRTRKTMLNELRELWGSIDFISLSSPHCRPWEKQGLQSWLDNSGRERRQAPAKPVARPHSLRERAPSDRPGVALLEKTDYAREHIAKPW